MPLSPSLYDNPYYFPLQWWEAQRSGPDLGHQRPAPGPDSDPPAGYRHPAKCFGEGAAHSGKRTNTSAGQSCGIPHALCCKYTVSQLQRGTKQIHSQNNLPARPLINFENKNCANRSLQETRNRYTNWQDFRMESFKKLHTRLKCKTQATQLSIQAALAVQNGS